MDIPPAVWDLAQGEIHNKRGLVAAVTGGISNVQRGLWTFEEFAAWWQHALKEHEAAQTRAVARMAKKPAGTMPPPWCPLGTEEYSQWDTDCGRCGQHVPDGYPVEVQHRVRGRWPGAMRHVSCPIAEG